MDEATAVALRVSAVHFYRLHIPTVTRVSACVNGTRYDFPERRPEGPPLLAQVERARTGMELG